jgi:putative transposase
MSNIIKFEIDSKIFYKDLEYIIKGYPSFMKFYSKEILLHLMKKSLKSMN